MGFKKVITRKRTIIVAVLIGIFSITLVSYEDQDFEIMKNMDIYYTLFRELNLFYVDETDPGELIKTSIDNMLKSLDPYTVYIPESKIEDYRFMTTGQYGGIGALIRKSGDHIIIAEPYENFPVTKAGLRAGDIILEIDGISTQQKTTQAISEKLKGQPNTEVSLKIKRPYTEKTFDAILTREKIKINPVPYYGMLTNEIGYILLSNFTEKSGKDVKSALIDLKENSGAKSIVLDLRGNPGGLLIEAVHICNLFVDKGTEIVSTKGKAKQWDRTYKAMNNATDKDIPVVVLVNRGSASASEIVSGTLQDLDRGVIIGERTFGKGLVQTTRKLSYNAQLKITTAKYYIPSGRCIQALDYSHRNEDGSVGKIPDSLITRYTTKNGRNVYDGGGIIPDIKIDANTPANIIVSLFRKNLLFEFATKFRNDNDSISSVDEFEISDKIYSDFIAFLADKLYDYETESEKTIKKLETMARKEKYYDDIAFLIDSLKITIETEKKKDVEKFSIQIKEFLTGEIVSRYYYQKGRIEASLDYDKEIEKAIEVLEDLAFYASVLDGTYIEEEGE